MSWKSALFVRIINARPQNASRPQGICAPFPKGITTIVNAIKRNEIQVSHRSNFDTDSAGIRWMLFSCMRLTLIGTTGNYFMIQLKPLGSESADTVRQRFVVHAV